MDRNSLLEPGRHRKPGWNQRPAQAPDRYFPRMGLLFPVSIPEMRLARGRTASSYFTPHFPNTPKEGDFTDLKADQLPEV